jgi:hypothetical protein
VVCRFDVSAVFDDDIDGRLTGVDDDLEDDLDPELDGDEELEPLDADR